MGDMTLDLLVEECPNASRNFLKLCKLKYYHGCLFFNVQQDFMVQSGDPTGTGRGGCCATGVVAAAAAAAGGSSGGLEGGSVGGTWEAGRRDKGGQGSHFYIYKLPINRTMAASSSSSSSSSGGGGGGGSSGSSGGGGS